MTAMVTGQLSSMCSCVGNFAYSYLTADHSILRVHKLVLSSGLGVAWSRNGGVGKVIVTSCSQKLLVGHLRGRHRRKFAVVATFEKVPG